MAAHDRPRSATHVTPAPATLEKLRPLFQKRVRRIPKGHWLWLGKVSRDWNCLFTRQGTWGAAKAFWVYSGRVLLAGQRLWRTCPEPRCVAPEHHTTTPPAWSAKRRAAEQRRKASIRGASSARVCETDSGRGRAGAASDSMERWAAAGRE